MTRFDKDLVVLAAMPPVQLRALWEAMRTGDAPSVPTPLLRRMLAQWLQEKRRGELPLRVVCELEQVSAVAGGTPLEPQRQSVTLTPGPRLIRELNG